ncbi:MAG: peroxidase, partial [Bacteroidota bacterium]
MTTNAPTNNQAFFSYLHEESDITDIILREGKRFTSLSIFSEKVLRGPSDFSIAERETMAAYVSALNNCTYCHNTHLAVAQQFGVDGKLLGQLIEGINSTPISEKLKPVYQYIKKLTLEPSKMIKSDADRVFSAGWSEQALADAICVCALFNCYNRLLDGYGIKGTKEGYINGAKQLSKRGYRISWIPRFL